MIKSINIGSKTRKLILKISFILGALVFIAGLESCFKEVDTVKLEPLETITAINSIDSTQTYYKIEANEIRLVDFNQPKDWDLGLETGDQGWHIIINYSSSAKIISTGISEFSEVDINTANDLLPVDDINWGFDHPNGNLDSTATGNWIDSAIVYILYRGITFENQEAYYKIKFESVDVDKYLITYSDLNTEEVHNKTVLKDNGISFVYFSFTEGETNFIDPGKNEWDLLFTPYHGYYKTLIGTEAPYRLTGVYMNYLNGTEVIKIDDASVLYEEIDYTYIEQYESSTIQDAIGYDWKQIPNPPDYRYYIDENIKYIILALDGHYYKFRFLSFYNELDEKGYPVFEYKLLI